MAAQGSVGGLRCGREARPTSPIPRLPTPGSDGRKVAMRLYGKWFAPDIAFALGKPAPQRPQLVAFAAPVPLTRGGVRRPELGAVVAWSQLLSLLAFETKRQAVLPLFECAGVLAPTGRHAWVVSKPPSAPGGGGGGGGGGGAQPRQVACAYRVGQG